MLFIRQEAFLILRYLTNARHTSSMVSRIDFGFPGRLRMRDFPRSPAVCLDSTAVGTYLLELRHVSMLMCHTEGEQFIAVRVDSEQLALG